MLAALVLTDHAARWDDSCTICEYAIKEGFNSVEGEVMADQMNCD